MEVPTTKHGIQYSETTSTRMIKGNYTVRQTSEYKSGVAIFKNKKFIIKMNTIQEARNFLETVTGI